MTIVRTIYHIARADFLNRARRYSFLVMLGSTLFLGCAVASGRIQITFGQYRGVCNSAWVGLEMGVIATLALSFAGFYLVKNAVDRDIETGVSHILASSPIAKLEYVTGKVLSNFAVLSMMVLILAVFAGVEQLLVGKDRHLHAWPLLAPFVLVALPAVAFVSALAVLFDTIPWLRRGGGNIAFFSST